MSFQDGAGNELKVGMRIVLTKIDRNMIGTIKMLDEGGANLGLSDKRPKNARMQIIFDVTLVVLPNMTRMENIFRVIDPSSERVVQEALDKNPEPPIQ